MAQDISLHKRLPIPYVFHLLLLEVNWQLFKAFTFLREFVFGNNKQGLVVGSGDYVTVIGGENATLAGENLPAADEIYYGSATTQSTYIAPSAARAAWKAFIQTETATGNSRPTPWVYSFAFVTKSNMIIIKYHTVSMISLFLKVKSFTGNLQ